MKMAKARAGYSGYGSYRKSGTPRAPARKVVRGRGGYISDIVQGVGSQLAGLLGNGLEGLVGTGMKALTGFGAYAPYGYSVKKNSFNRKLSEGNDPAEIRNAKEGRFIIRHREFLQDIYSPFGDGDVFNVQSYKINPGLPDTFPWLSTVAQNFEQYALRGMIFEFKSCSSDYNGGVGQLGTVIMATEYDSTRPSFSSKQQMENHQYSSSCKPSYSMLHPIECSRSSAPLTELYVRTGSVPEGNDARLYDFGEFQIATQGIPTAHANLGELWVTYEIELLKPRMNGIGAMQLSSFYYNTSTTVTAANYFGTTGLMKSPNNDFDMELTSNTIYFPQELGEAVLVLGYSVQGTSVTVVHPILSAMQGCIIDETSNNPFNQGFFGPAGSAAGSKIAKLWVVRLTGDAPGIITFSGATLPGTNSGMILWATTIQQGCDWHDFINASYATATTLAKLQKLKPVYEDVDSDEDEDAFVLANYSSKDLLILAKRLQEVEEQEKQETPTPSPLPAKGEAFLCGNYGTKSLLAIAEELTPKSPSKDEETPTPQVSKEDPTPVSPIKTEQDDLLIEKHLQSLTFEQLLALAKARAKDQLKKDLS